jgi:ABC-2 type transport system permease protein
LLRWKIIYATVIKEWLLIRRDLGGLLILLVMPAILILIMALVQDAPFRDYQDLQLKVLVADQDQGSLGRAVTESLRKSASFELIDSIDGQPISADELHQYLQHGQYRLGLIIPQGASGEIANAANTVANSLSGSFSGARLPQRPARDSLSIRLVFDPVSRPAFRLAIHAALDKAVSAASMQLLLRRISQLSGSSTDTVSQQRLLATLEGLSILDEQAGRGGAAMTHINSVQHNVPAWAIFGMFFIVVPLGGHIVREREQGSALRVMLIPGASLSAAIGRILANTFVCCLQFVAMCMVGLWLMPVVGLPALDFGAQPAALIPVVLATALCATAYGNFIGSVFTSGIQAVAFGAISIVILSALGGIWVPVELLPQAMQEIARFSPLHWGLEGIQAIILRQGNWLSVLKPTLMLIILAAILLVAGYLGRQKGAQGF